MALRLLLTGLVVWCGCLLPPVQAQHGHPYFRQYTTDDGLPSSETHGCMEDERGYLWVATDNGLARFDGYSFKTYGLEEGLPELSVMALQKDTLGRIWLATLSGLLFYLEGDTIRSFSGNDTLRRTKNWYFSQFLIDEDDNKYVSRIGEGIWQFKEGQGTVYRASEYKKNMLFFRQFDQERLLGFIELRKNESQQQRTEAPSNAKTLTLEIQSAKDTSYITTLLRKENNIHNYWSVTFSDSLYWLGINGQVLELGMEALQRSRTVDYYTQDKMILTLPDGRIWVGCLKNKGLREHANRIDWWNERYRQLLPDKTITHLYQDQRGGVWVATLEDGIFYCPDPSSLIFDAESGLTNTHVSALEVNSAQEVLFGTRDGQVFRGYSSTGSLEVLPAIPRSDLYLRGVGFDATREQVLAFTPLVYTWNGSRWVLRESNGLGFSYPATDGQGYWGAINALIQYFDLQQARTTFSFEITDDPKRVNVVRQLSDDRVWVGRVDGLWLFKDSTLQRPLNGNATLATRIDDIAELPGGQLVLATRGAGLLLWSATQYQQLSMADGLSSNTVRNVFVDDQARIWAGTQQGLLRLTRNTDRTWDIQRFTDWHGLPSNEITQVRSAEGQIWVATTGGVLRWQEPQPDTTRESPLLEHLLVNKAPVPFSTALCLRHGENNLQFQYLRINLNQSGRIPYRYRLNGADWIFTEERTARFTALPPGDYRFEVQAQNQDAIWSKSLVQDFIILAPWWQRWWFYTLLALLVGATVYTVYRSRIRALAHDYKLHRQIDDLERRALRAQMNPHFIFNCLNSIQLLISQGDNEQAMRYLSRFAKLVRDTLELSLSGEVSLEEEIEQLENYLSLEKLRFKDAFDYEILVAPELDVYAATFPPMLLQPFVENAVIHGMQNQKQGGLIRIQFEPAGERLRAVITDNGPGIYHDNTRNTHHKSVGMSLTQRRLELLHGQVLEDWMQVRELTDENGAGRGTEVIVLL